MAALYFKAEKTFYIMTSGGLFIEREGAPVYARQAGLTKHDSLPHKLK